ncbi:MAG: M20/M25/M40 family metallo-hydrolase [Xanthomonadales bacterium]|nr:M20/M25/M40 family metallo-hydrolase [Xanthomonadales bacterium]NIN58806.1 M20/M25/M40 family metallo-hydrolase [Xanthomonadales bacterium]NIN74074.1 M20/M25/M40 family metallo-hydrolase [Xanthomonadales bacterium]NIO14607.1 M20/M25/M40 family metallo-hydrolase [Xanthomonadales bacterium]NIP11199.1 M20/M25/M40 family metallo-hydrolase [Xanthomonadales bacterium]
MDQQAAAKFIDEMWMDSIVPELVEYIRIPNKSPHFDPDWESNGYMEDAVQQIFAWCRAQPIPDMTAEIVRLPGRTPLIFMEIPASEGDGEDTILLYGHLDKQPEMTGWADGLGPWQPVIREDKLYGRGGADDGYAAYGSLAAIMAVQRQQLPHARCVVLIEACEESGSYDLPAYIEHLSDRIGQPSLVVCLDSGAGNYDQLWLTVSLRGMAAGTLRVDVTREGVHSGSASGMVPSSFRILRQLLSRLEDEATGRVLPEYLQAEIPEQRLEQTRAMCEALGDSLWREMPLLDGVQPMAEDNLNRQLNRTWRPALSYTGVDGMPPLGSAGNVLRPHTALKLSMRLPPTLDGEAATVAMQRSLEADPPSGARVRFEPDQSASGWNAPAVAPWLHESLERASLALYGQSVMYMGEGGTIPFMAMLGDAYPGAQFMITGVLGPKSNAHGPNEFLHIPYARRLTACVARVIADHRARDAG